MSSKLLNQGIGQIARLGHREEDRAGVGDISATKAVGLKEGLVALLADPDVRQQIGSAWPLYMMLMLRWNGEIAGTRDEIGMKLGEDGRNVGNWVTALEKTEIVKVTRLARKMSVTLTGDHLRAALSRDQVAIQPQAAPADPVLDDRQKTVLRLIDDAKATGGTIEIRVALN